MVRFYWSTFHIWIKKAKVFFWKKRTLMDIDQYVWLQKGHVLQMSRIGQSSNIILIVTFNSVSRNKWKNFIFIVFLPLGEGKNIQKYIIYLLTKAS